MSVPHFVCLRFSGVLNPARDFGPRLATLITHGMLSMTDCLPYIVAPLIGGPLGALLAEHMIGLN